MEMSGGLVVFAAVEPYSYIGSPSGARMDTGGIAALTPSGVPQFTVE